MAKRVSLTVHNATTGALVASPTAWSNLRWLDELDDAGTFSVDIQADDPTFAQIRKGMLLRISIDLTPVWTGLIERRRVRKIARRTADKLMTLVGVGQVKLLKRSTVDPSGGLGRFPFADARTFDWTAPEFDDTAWPVAVVTPANYGLTTENYGLPEGFPDGTAEWIWNVDSSGSVPPGTKYMRGTGTATTTRVREAWGASDDTFDAYLQGIHILRSGDTAYVGRTSAVELLVSAGPITAAARVTNLNPLKAGLLFSLLTPLDASEAPSINTGADWKVKPDAAPLGMTAGKILIILFAEAAARGEQVPAVTFTATLDSAGVAWTTYEQLPVPVGTTYLDVLRQMVGLEMCEFRMSPGSYTLNVFNPGGAGSNTGFVMNESNLVDLEFDEVDLEASSLLVRWERGYIRVDDAQLIADAGRRGGFLALGGLGSSSAAQTQAGEVLSRIGAQTSQVSLVYDSPAIIDEPYRAFDPGDSVTVLKVDEGSDLQRVVAVAGGADRAGGPLFEVQLSSVIVEQSKRQQVTLDRLANGTLSGRSSAASTPYQPRPVRPREPETVDWSESGAVVVMAGAAKTFQRAIRVRELRVELLTPSSTGTVDVDLLKDGAVVASVSVPAGSRQKYTPVTDVVFSQRPANVMTTRVTAPGVDADTITITVVYA